MKRVPIFISIIVIITGCDIFVPEPPVLISPVDADTVKLPTLVWGSKKSSDSYHLFVYQGQPEAGNLILSHKLVDTTYTIASTLEPATHYWRVEVDGESSDYNRFVTYTLDESYYPIGQNYRWDYMKVKGNWWSMGSSYDTSFFSIEVVSFIEDEDSLYVEVSKSFRDVKDKFIYKHDSIFMFVDDMWLGGKLFPEEGDGIYFPYRPPPTADSIHIISDTTFSIGVHPYYNHHSDGYPWDFWDYVVRQKGKGMILHIYGEEWTYNDAENDHGWDEDIILINLDKGT